MQNLPMLVNVRPNRKVGFMFSKNGVHERSWTYVEWVSKRNLGFDPPK